MERKYDSKDVIHDEGKESNDAKSDSKSSAVSLSDDELINRVKDYFFSDPILGQELESFAEKHVDIVRLDEIESNEYRLEYTDVYEQYRSLFERKIESFIMDTLDSSIQRFYNALSTKIEQEPDGADAVFGELLLGVTNFDCFVLMMKDKARDMLRK
jgi:hypothetical protein